MPFLTLALCIPRSRGAATFPPMPGILRPDPAANTLGIALLADLWLGDPFVLVSWYDVSPGEGAWFTDMEVGGGLVWEGHGFGEHE